MASNGFLRSKVGSALLYGRRPGSIAPFIPALSGTDKDKQEVDLVTYAYWPGFTPLSTPLDFIGNTAVYVNKFIGNPASEDIRYTFNTATLISTDVWSFTGRGYKTTLNATFSVDYGITFGGRGYSAALESYGGFLFNGAGYKVTPDFGLTPDYNITFNAGGYVAALSATVDATIPISFTGRGYTYTPELLGGFILEGQGYSYNLQAAVDASELITFTGQGYSASLQATVISVTDIQFTGRGYVAALQRDAVFIGRGYSVQPSMVVSFSAPYAEAVVMNILNKAVSRYQNYPFLHVAPIGGSYYGFTSDGVYKLEGTKDNAVPVNGTIWTNDDDLGAFQSKNIPYVYLNGDDDYSVTAVVDSVDQPTFTSGFSGRRAKLARGSKGRYWYFKISGISKLQGLEYLPDGLSRRVK